MTQTITRPPPEMTRVGFHDPFLRGSPKMARLAQVWLQGYSRSHPGAIHSITLTSENPPRIELWVELPSHQTWDAHIDEIVLGVQKLLNSASRETNLILVPKSLVDKFSKPLDFQVTKC